jgi:hypothetical protein
MHKVGFLHTVIQLVVIINKWSDDQHLSISLQTSVTYIVEIHSRVTSSIVVL